MARPIVVEDEIVDHEGPARSKRLAKLTEDRHITFRRLLVRNVGIDREVIFRGAEVSRVEIAVNRLEAIRDSEVRHESAADFVYVWPIELGTDGLFIRAEPDRRPDTGATSDIQPGHRARLSDA